MVKSTNIQVFFKLNYSKSFFQNIKNVKSLTAEIRTLRNKLVSAQKKAENAHEHVRDLHISLAKFIEALKQANVEKFDVSIIKLIISDEM